MFNDFFYYFFLILVVLVVYIVPKQRNLLLLIASYYFYATQQANFVLLLFFVSITSYTGAIAYQKWPHKKKHILLLSIFLHLSLLVFYKYYDFGCDNLILVGLKLPELDILLPIGISFYTFQSMSYLIDCYYKAVPIERNIIRHLLYIAFFPQLVAGPIVKARHFLPQLKNKTLKLNSQDVYFAIKCIVIGVFLKIVIADNLAFYTSSMQYPMYEYRHSLNLLVLCYAFMVQIFCDFGGYSLVAIGSARLLGFHLPQNFNYPFSAVGFNDFWRRWHITLTSWFKDYVFLRIAMRPKKKSEMYYAILITFLLSGLWHGANWCFVIWGGLHGLFCIFEQLVFSKLKIRKPSGLFKVFWWFLCITLICIVSLFFYHSDVSQVKAYLIAMTITNWDQPLLLPRLGDIFFYLSFIALYHIFPIIRRNIKRSEIILNLEIIILTILILLSLNLWGESHEFIYFRF
jgi:alginate O-acetyltransferase complex protein AlgI